MDKSTHGFEELTLWQPVVKSNEGKYIAVLSDTSVDRDDEIIGKDALQSIIDNDGYTAILLNHENIIQNQIGEWVNKRLETIGEHTALVAEPKFYLSNPQAKMIKGMLDDGAKMGISIGAIPTGAIEKKCADGRTRKEFTGLELLEASFVAIPSNRHGQALAMAKMLKSSKVNKMTEEKLETLQKNFDAKNIEFEAVAKEFSEYKEQVAKDLEKAKIESDKLVKSTEAVKKEIEEEKAKVEEADKKVKETEEKLKETEKSLEEAKAVHKAQHDTEEGNVEIAKDAMPIFRK